MAFRNKTMTMPSIDDIIMQIMAMSESFYGGIHIIGWGMWDTHRPAKYPTAKYLLRFYGYAENSAGWAALVDEHIGIDVKTFTEIMREQGEARAQKRCDLSRLPDYTARPDAEYLAAVAGDGLTICADTYRRTGRMILR